VWAETQIGGWLLVLSGWWLVLSSGVLYYLGWR